MPPNHTARRGHLREPDSLGERVRRLRTALGMTLPELARRAGVSPPFISHVEHGRRLPAEDTMRALARALKVSPLYLEEVRLTRQTCAVLERDPELLRVVTEAVRSPRVRKRVLEAYVAPRRGRA